MGEGDAVPGRQSDRGHVLYGLHHILDGAVPNQRARHPARTLRVHLTRGGHASAVNPHPRKYLPAGFYFWLE